MQIGTEPLLTITTLSCKRLTYLRETVSAMRLHFRDTEPELPVRWICADNGSYRNDQLALLEMGFDEVLILARNCGIGPAMNRVVPLIRTPFLLHLEDDWVLTNPLQVRFIQEAMAIMTSDQRIGQIKLDKRNPEEFEDRRLYDGPFRCGDAAVQYYVRNPNSMWGGFTFPAAIASVAALRAAGPFAEDKPFHRGFCESEYSARFSRTFVTAASPQLLLFRHIGLHASDGWADYDGRD